MKNNNNEILSRREFFKKTAKGALPFLAFGMFGPSILSACSKNEDEEWINQRTGERESDGSQGNDNNLSGTWIGSFISFVFNPDGSGTFMDSYSGESGSCTYNLIETNKGVIGLMSNGTQSVTYYFIVNGNTMSLYSDSDYTGQIAQLTKQAGGNTGGGNNNGGGCNDCSGGCANGCGDGCSSSCYSSCAVECVGQCSSGCMGSCSSSCTGSCSTGCRNTCTYSCSGRNRL